MELRHLRYFVAVAEELHFRRAAERLHVAQPAVSEQIRKLETELGVALLNRTQRSVSLTPAGLVMLEEAKRVLRHADFAAHAARGARARGLGRLRVGYLPDVLPRYIPQTLARFAAAAPGIAVTLETGDPLRLAADVRNGSLDVAVVSLPLASGGLRVTSLGQEGAVCAMPAGTRLSSLPAVAPQQIAETPLVLMPRTANPAFFDGVIATWRAAGLAAAPIETSEPLVEHVLLAVAAGAGFAVLPASVAERHNLSGIRFVPLEAELGSEVAILSREEDSTIITGFLRVARTMARASERVSASAPPVRCDPVSPGVGVEPLRARRPATITRR
jgi:DNA-binding transcriptional LysR family regulator